MEITVVNETRSAFLASSLLHDFVLFALTTVLHGQVEIPHGPVNGPCSCGCRPLGFTCYSSYNYSQSLSHNSVYLL